VFAAPVAITRERAQKGTCRALLINSGNANAYTGQEGYRDAIKLTQSVAEKLNVNPQHVIPMSTGVIGHRLPMERMLDRINGLVAGLNSTSFMDVAHAIMTTDTRPKTVSLTVDTDGGPVKIVGMAKGAGMIAPNMATMLSIMLVDAELALTDLNAIAGSAADKTFNRITIDGDTSTNDTFIVLAGGRTDCTKISGSKDLELLSDAMEHAAWSLSKQILQDGEGTTKIIEIRVRGADSADDAKKIARKIAESPLVKTAFHGEDPNWGRIICAAGNAGCNLNPDVLELRVGDVVLVQEGAPASGEWEQAAHAVMKQPEFTVVLDLHMGESEESVWTTDLSEEYVGINADYRS
jgi:glutamate N-acetyltransferase/amino-acid N-acetyltransferase